VGGPQTPKGVDCHVQVILAVGWVRAAVEHGESMAAMAKVEPQEAASGLHLLTGAGGSVHGESDAKANERRVHRPGGIGGAWANLEGHLREGEQRQSCTGEAVVELNEEGLAEVCMRQR